MSAAADPIRYHVTGMDCASCAAKIEGAARKVEGVGDVKVSIASQIMTLKVDDPARRLPVVERAVMRLGWLGSNILIVARAVFSRMAWHARARARPLLAATVATCLLVYPGAATSQPADLVRLEVLPGWRTGEGQHMAALRLTLASGWKTYWRAPGAAGLAPIFDFSTSSGIETTELRWPVPDVFDFNGLRSIGYHDAVTIPIDIALNGSPARLSGEIEIGVCDKVCVPVRLTFSADLPEEGDRDPVIVAALVDQPMTGRETGTQAACTVASDTEGLDLRVRLTLPPLGSAEVVVIESTDPGLWISEATSWREGGALLATARALARDGGPAALDRSHLLITVLGENKAVEVEGCHAG